MAKNLPDPTGLDDIPDADLRETVHWRTGGLILDFALACGATEGPNAANLARVTCKACLAAGKGRS